jgi:hypothetical protein
MPHHQLFLDSQGDNLPGSIYIINEISVRERVQKLQTKSLEQSHRFWTRTTSFNLKLPAHIGELNQKTLAQRQEKHANFLVKTTQKQPQPLHYTSTSN